MYSKIAFVDFDGTITAEETLDGALKLIIPKEEFEKRYTDLLNKKVTLSQVLHEAFNKTPSARLPEILAYIDGVPIRNGFSEFLDFMQECQIPVVVISGGIRPMLDSKIKSFQNRILDLYCVDLDTKEKYMKLKSDYDDGIELLKKTDVMKGYEYETAICIGDSHTDINIAAASDIVFARDLLADYMRKTNRHYYEWGDFFDIIQILKSI